MHQIYNKQIVNITKNTKPNLNSIIQEITDMYINNTEKCTNGVSSRINYTENPKQRKKGLIKTGILMIAKSLKEN